MSANDDTSPQIVTFTLGGIEFEYDEEKNQKNIEKHGISFRNAAQLVCFLTMIALNFMMKNIVKMRTDIIRLGILRQVKYPEMKKLTEKVLS